MKSDKNINEIKNIILNSPLYKKNDIDDERLIHDLEYFNDTLELYCTKCKKDSIFEIVHEGENKNKVMEHISIGAGSYNRSTSSSDSHKKKEENRFFYLEFKCRLNSAHKIRYYFYVDFDNKIYKKVGQYPSTADLNLSELSRYKKFFVKDNDYNEFKKAIGLISHGIGIGSYVYLRRIFENFIFDTYDSYFNVENKNDFLQLRMSDKINKLEKYLPKLLVDNKEIYSILSIGIHELTEENCLKYFDTLKDSILLILEEKYEATEKEKRIIELKKSINAINSEITKNILVSKG